MVYSQTLLEMGKIIRVLGGVVVSLVSVVPVLTTLGSQKFTREKGGNMVTE